MPEGSPSPVINEASSISRIGDFLRDKRNGIGLFGATALLVTTSVVACSGGDGGSNENESGTTTEASTTIDSSNGETTTTETELVIPGGYADGSDEAVRADNNRGLFECGPREDDVAGDSTYDPDSYVEYMQENSELANELNEFNKNDMGEAAYDFIIDNAAVNPLASEPNKGGEATLLNKRLIATTAVPEGTLALNHSCVDGINPYDVRTLHTGESTLLGLALTQDDFEQWQQLVRDAGKDPDHFISFSITADVNEDGKIQDEEVLQFVTLYHGVCKNPQRTVPPQLLPPETIPPQITTPDTPPETTSTSTPTTVVTTTITTIPTTTFPDKEPEPTPGPGIPGTTQPKPEGEPGTEPTTSTTRPPATSSTTQATVPSTTAPTTPITPPLG